MDDWFFGWFATYGLPAAFVLLIIDGVGAPCSSSLLLLLLGSYVAQSEFDLLQVLGTAVLAIAIGDSIGYAIGRVAGRLAVDAIARRVGRVDAVGQAEAFAARWGAAGIFLSRCVFGELAPWVNLSSGAAHYPWPRFVLWSVLGDAVWVGIYVTLGRLFSDRVQALADLVGSVRRTAPRDAGRRRRRVAPAPPRPPRGCVTGRPDGDGAPAHRWQVGRA